MDVSGGAPGTKEDSQPQPPKQLPFSLGTWVLGEPRAHKRELGTQAHHLLSALGILWLESTGTFRELFFTGFGMETL